MTNLSVAEARERLTYHPETGELRWTDSKKNPKQVRGRIAGSVSWKGYRGFRILDRAHRCHRVCWMIFYGEVPSIIDHINGDRADNRIENLRLATHAENMQNRRKNSGNRTGYKGVHFDNRMGVYRADIEANKVRYFLGRFGTAEEAHKAYMDAARRLHGNFAHP